MTETHEHQPGKLDFQIVTKDVSVTEFRRKPSTVWDYLKTPGHVISVPRCTGYRLMKNEERVTTAEIEQMITEQAL